MANYAGNPIHGGVKLVGPDQQAAADAFNKMLGMAGGSGGLGAGQFLTGGANAPSLPVASDPVMSALATGGNADPMAALMGLLGGSMPAGDPASALMALLGGAGAGAPTDAGASAAPNPQVQLEDAVVTALSNPDFARELVRREPAVLQKVVKYLSNTGGTVVG